VLSRAVGDLKPCGQICEVDKLGRLILIRHCETDSNASGLVQGSSDLPLSVRGVVQAGLVGAHVKRHYEIDMVVTSDRSRCVETANTISSSAAPTSLLRELDFGSWEGQKWSSIRSEYPEDFDRLLNYDPEFAPPGGETISSMNNRLETAITEYDLHQPLQTTAVVAHDGVLRFLIASILGWPSSSRENMSLFNGCISTIFFGDKVPSLDLLNHYDHLSSTYEESVPN
jgi:broad specificity phosphatase PhoE